MAQIRQRHMRLRIHKRAIMLVVLLIMLMSLLYLAISSNTNSVNIVGDDMLDPPGSSPQILPTPSPASQLKALNPHTSAQVSGYGFFTELEINYKAASSYLAAEKTDFERNKPYQTLSGVLSFRGNNLRTNAAYGAAEVSSKTLINIWRNDTGSLQKGEGGSPQYTGSWTGSGWTGQPLLIKWPEETKAIMNINDAAKAKKDLVEVIYATMDGHIYFFDLETGDPTRGELNIGIPFKGAGSLDPRGYPLLYIGSGDHYNEAGKESQAMIISLIDGKVLYTFGNKPDSFALRDWHAYDSAPLIDAETDTLIFPGENGILYSLCFCLFLLCGLFCKRFAIGYDQIKLQKINCQTTSSFLS